MQLVESKFGSLPDVEISWPVDKQIERMPGKRGNCPCKVCPQQITLVKTVCKTCHRSFGGL